MIEGHLLKNHRYQQNSSCLYGHSVFQIFYDFMDKWHICFFNMLTSFGKHTAPN